MSLTRQCSPPAIQSSATTRHLPAVLTQTRAVPARGPEGSCRDGDGALEPERRGPADAVPTAMTGLGSLPVTAPSVSATEPPGTAARTASAPETSPPQRHERAFPHTAAMHRYTGWAAGRVCDRGARLAEWLGRLITGNGTAITGSGLGWGRFAAWWHVIARSVSTLAGKADTASGRVAEQSGCLRRKRWRERDDPRRLSPGSVGHASIHSVHMRVNRAPVTAARLLDGARSLLGHQTRYAAVGCHHGLQVLQPTR
jgi:hypothetical protein